MSDTEDLRDALPADLDVGESVGPYQFPDNSRRRRPAYLYFAIAAVCLALWLLRRGHDPVMVNNGVLVAAIVLALILAACSGALIHVIAGRTRCSGPGKLH